jgi:hypothetical protein
MPFLGEFVRDATVKKATVREDLVLGKSGDLLGLVLGDTASFPFFFQLCCFRPLGIRRLIFPLDLDFGIVEYCGSSKMPGAIPQ